MVMMLVRGEMQCPLKMLYKMPGHQRRENIDLEAVTHTVLPFVS
jgi:hypothetical protein